MKTRILPCLAALTLVSGASAAPLQSAKITRVFNDVKIHAPGASTKGASVGTVIRGRTSLQTGRNSRSELQFQDATLTRIGQNSVFSFQQGSRDLQLEQGTILLQVPKRRGGAQIRTATVTAAITGTTIMMEYYKGKWCKIIVLEGELEAYLNKVKRRVKIGPGQMLVMPANARKIPKPVDVDLAKLQKSSALAGTKFFAALPPAAQAQISQTVAKQQTLIKSGALATSNARGARPPAAARVANTAQNAGNIARSPQRDVKWWEHRPHK